MSNMTIDQAISHARANHAPYLAGFQELLRIPSISTDPTYDAEVERCAQWVVDELNRIGFKNCQVMPSDGHPVVYGEWLEAGPEKPTVLVYAHYDVQPVDPLELWETPPFEPTLREGKLFARGVIDDKVGVYTNLKAFESMFAADGKLPINVKVFFEGEEESASPNMLPFVREHRELLQADFLLISDGGPPKDQPVLFYSVRGCIDARVRVTGPIRDLHSGKYGGVVHNPIHVVGQIIESFHDAEGRVQIAGYHDRVRGLSEVEKEAMLEAVKLTLPKMKTESGVKQFWGEAVAPFAERATALPTLDVNGVWGGYQGPGVKTIIPAEAGFKVTMRLVADQDHEEIGQLFKAHVEQFVTDTVEIEVEVINGMGAVTMLHGGPVVEAMQRAYAATWGQEALLFRAGGSVPITSMFQAELDMPITMMGFGTGENGHSPNEFLWLDYFYRGIETAIHFYYGLTE